MKKYIETKQVEAEPMTMGEACRRNLLQHGRMPTAIDKDAPGYYVKCENGYESWSPAGPFEEAYKLADTALDRMLIESNELTTKLQKLQMFACTSKFMELDDMSRAMLIVQMNIMENYQTILKNRYVKMKSNEDGLRGLSFGFAILLLKSRYAVRRAGWNGKGMFVIKQVPSHINSDTIPKTQSLPQYAKNLIMKGKGFVDYTDQCLIYNQNTGRADSWNPSIADVFAEDWEIVTE